MCELRTIGSPQAVQRETDHPPENTTSGLGEPMALCPEEAVGTRTQHRRVRTRTACRLGREEPDTQSPGYYRRESAQRKTLRKSSMLTWLRRALELQSLEARYQRNALHEF